MQDQTKNSRSYSSLTGFHRAVPIILYAFAAFFGLCFVTQNIGAFGKAVSGVLLGLFSYGAYAVPFLLALHGYFYPSDIHEKRLIPRIIFSLIALISISALAYTITYWNQEVVFSIKEFYANGKTTVGGGAVGNTVAYGIIKMFGSVGLIIIAIAMFALYITYFFSKGQSTVGFLFMSILKGFVSIGAFFERKIHNMSTSVKKAKAEKRKKIEEEKNSELYDDDFFDVDNGIKKLEISELGINEEKSDDSASRTTLHDKVFHKSAILEDEEVEPKVNQENVGQGHKKRVLDMSYAVGNAELFENVKDEPVAEKKDIIIEEVKEVPKENTSAAKDEKKDIFGLDQCAADVFTKDFDPFELATSEKLSSKLSTKSILAKKAEEKTPTVKEDLFDLTEEDMERKKQEDEKRRRQEEFERRKQQIINANKNQATPVHNSGEVTEPRKTVEFHESETQPKEVITEESTSTNLTFEKTVSNEVVHEEEVIESAEEKDFLKDEGSNHIFDNSDYKRSAYERVAGFATATQQAYLKKEEPVVEKKVVEPSVEVEKKDSDVDLISNSFGNAEAKTEFKPFEVPKEEEKQVFEFPEETSEKETLSVERTMLYEGNSLANDEVLEVPEEVASCEMKNDESADIAVPIDEEDEVVSVETEEDSEWQTEEIPEDERNPKVEEYRDRFNCLREDDKNAESSEKLDTDTPPFEISEENGVENVVENSGDFTVSNDRETEEIIEENEESVEVLEEVEPLKEPVIPENHASEVHHEEVKKEEEPAPKKKIDYSNYTFPPIDFLGFDKAQDEDLINEEIQRNTRILIETLDSFNVTASIKGVDRGPRVTRYEVVPARGVKVQQITNLFNDIALNLAAEGIRMEAPIPGKSAIGFEIPNTHPTNVRIRELLECEEFTSSKSKTYCCLGKDVAGNPIFGDISKFPHCLVAGATGMGKSVCINSMIVSMIYKARPDEVKFIMIDPKKVEFEIYSGIPHLLVPVVTEPKQAAGALMWACEEMERRYDTIKSLSVRNIDAYNEKVEENPELGEKLSKIIIIVDELNDLMLKVRNPVEDLIMNLAQKARAAGIHLIIGTQRPEVKVITGTIKANINTRIACKVASNVDSRTILDMSGAEKLLDKGDMLYKPTNRTEPIRVQGSFVSDDEISKIMNFIRSQTDGDVYDDSVVQEMNKSAQKCGNSGSESSEDGDNEVGYYNDQQFLDAVELAIRQGKISTSLLQRKLSIGYGKAAKFIDAMEEIGVVSEPNGQKPRDVLITKDEWNEKLSRVSLD